MTKAGDWNKRMQEVLERTFRREARRMAQWPDGYQAIGQYSDRLLENGKKLRKDGAV